MKLKLSWEHICRNKKRTLITLATLFFAFILFLFTGLVNNNVYGSRINKETGSPSCYLHIHHKGFWNLKSFNNSFKEDDKLYKLLSNQKEVKAFFPRLESFALASFGSKAKTVRILGIVPEKENNTIHFNEKIIEGRDIRTGDKSVLLSEELANSLCLHVGDSVALQSQGYYGAIVEGKYPVKGIIRFGAPIQNRRLVKLPLKLMQKMYGAPNIVTTVSMLIKDGTDMTDLREKIISKIDTSQYEVMELKQLQSPKSEY